MAGAISRVVHDALIVAAAESPEVEICGLLFGLPDLIDAFEITRNVAPNPGQQFEIDPAALFRANKSFRGGGPRAVGYFHSHPNGLGEPSATDREQAAGDGMLWAIIANQQLSLWQSHPDGFEHVKLRIVD